MSRFLKMRSLWGLIIFVFIGFGLYKLADSKVPPQHLFWKPLDINAPIGIATKTQIMKISLGPRATCLTLLQSDATDTNFTNMEPQRNGKGCGWDVSLNATQIAGVKFRPESVESLCPVQISAYIWLQKVDESAHAILGSGLKRIHHYGTYSCRNIAGTQRLSEHAYANAWDVAAFELEDGRMITLAKHWDAGDERAGFLRAARDWGCAVFRVTLSPDYNAAHADHFHLDMGPSSTCR